MTGVFALVQRGTCAYADKINFAQAAGATGVIIYNADGNQDISQRLYVQNTGIPAALIGNNDGLALKTYLGANPNGTITLDPAMLAGDNPQVNTVAGFSSRGPSIGNFANTRDFALKPEIVAPGTGIYTATQTYDPNADTYNATGYTRVSGTSYAVPFAAGVAAMAKAKNPNLNTPGRLKSAVVNTASGDLQGTVHVTDAGAGKLNALDAVAVAATLEPAAISFGPVTALPVNRSLTLTNVSNASVTFTLAVRTIFDSTTAHVTLSDTKRGAAAGREPTDHGFAIGQPSGGRVVRRLYRRDGRGSGAASAVSLHRGQRRAVQHLPDAERIVYRGAQRHGLAAWHARGGSVRGSGRKSAGVV